MELMSILQDCNYKESEKMANITNYLNKIKTAVYGKDVRGAIHDAIKQVYDDASVNHDNANMEVKMARGTHNTLNDRLDKSEQKLDETNAQLSRVNNDLTIFNYKTQAFITPEQFGAVGDGVTDDTEAIQRASDNCQAGQKLLFGANKKYKISDTIVFYRTNVIDGNGCFIMMDDNFRGESRFAFRYDHTANDNNILDTFIMGKEIKNFNIQHYRNLEDTYFNGIFVA